MSSTILPGSAIGMFGSGQLGRMFAMAARRMGYRIHVYSPDHDSPTGQIADVEHTGQYDDADAIGRFVDAVDVVTFEFENVPAAAIDRLKGDVPVRPGGEILRTTQHRLSEKTFLRDRGIPVTGFRAIRSETDLAAAQASPFPAILKTASWGYDGKGQTRVDAAESLCDAWDSIDREEAILEELVDFVDEFSVVAARGMDGDFVAYPPIENRHHNHILDVSLCPSRLPAEAVVEATDVTRAIFEAFDVVGVMAVEFFLTSSGGILVNEIAPRPHNSGHLTIDAHVTCQFEQQVRTVCGLPLGSVQQLRPAVMANLLGDLWEAGEPDWAAACAVPGVKLHLYGKTAPRVGRKMGHLTAVADDIESAEQRALAARHALYNAAREPSKSK